MAHRALSVRYQRTLRALNLQLGDHRGVIGRPLEAARLDVYRARRAERDERGREQDVIDAQALLFSEREHAVIPPGIRALRLFEEAERIDESDAHEPTQRLALGRREMDLVGPKLRVVHVA